jgi:hypothetical protein
MKTINKKVLLGLMLLVCVTVAFAAVNVKGLIVDALTGYTVAGAAPNNYTLCGNGTVGTYQASCGAAAPVRTCNANGCYIRYSDGTIHAWGTITTASSGGTLSSGTITFPTAFTTVVQSLLVSGQSQPDSTDDAYVTYTKSGTTSGATVVIRCSINISGSGCSSLNAVPVGWIADGY